jgi:hypothetical protein
MNPNDEYEEVEVEPLTKEQGKTYGGLTKLAEKNWGKINAENQIKDILGMVMESGNEELIRKIYNKYKYSIQVNYKAVKGIYENKKGIKSECWNSIWGKYAGSVRTRKEPPTLNYYIDYNDEDFDYIDKKFKYNKKTFKHIDGTIIDVVV